MNRLLMATLTLALPMAVFAEPQFAAFKGVSCQSCHVDSYGGGMRSAKEGSWQWITPRLLVGGNFRLLGLVDNRPAGQRRLFFPMEGALHVNFEVSDNVSVVASNDFGNLRELYAYVDNLKKVPVAIKAGVFPLPYGLNIPDHTSFIKEGRVKNNNPNIPSQELGLGAGRFGSRYRDAGLEVSYDKKGPYFGHLAFTNGLTNLESRPLPGNQNNRGSAITLTEGIRWGHLTLGGSMFNRRDYNPTTFQNLQEIRYSGFGIFGLGPLALLTEYGIGKDYNHTAKTITQDIAAFYAELIWEIPEQFSSLIGNKAFLKLREEFLDRDRKQPSNILERQQISLDTLVIPHVSLETIYRKNKESPPVANDDFMLMTHVFF